VSRRAWIVFACLHAYYVLMGFCLPPLTEHFPWSQVVFWVGAVTWACQWVLLFPGYIPAFLLVERVLWMKLTLFEGQIVSVSVTTAVNAFAWVLCGRLWKLLRGRWSSRPTAAA
jgi:hypothetical protein